MKKTQLVYLLLLFIMSCGPASDDACPDASCDDYVTQAGAQAAFDADRDCMGELDNDSDGIACEHLGSGSGTGCPTTSNCGCSGKNKSECGGNCCQWIVGTGCRCK